MFGWIKNHILLTVGGVVAVLVLLLVMRKGSSSQAQSGVAYDGGLDPQTATAEVQAQAGLQAMQYQQGAQTAQAGYAVQANQDTIAGQLALAQIQSQTLDTQNTLAAQVASLNIGANEQLGENTNATQVALAQVAQQQAVGLANVQAGVINNQTNALVSMAAMQEGTARYAIKKKSSLCFITTVVCETLGKPDNCYELETLREYRDGWLTEHWPASMEHYKTIAPAIVDKIKAMPEEKRWDYCNNLYCEYLIPAINSILKQQPEAAFYTYTKMVVKCQID